MTTYYQYNIYLFINWFVTLFLFRHSLLYYLSLSMFIYVYMYILYLWYLRKGKERKGKEREEKRREEKRRKGREVEIPCFHWTEFNLWYYHLLFYLRLYFCPGNQLNQTKAMELFGASVMIKIWSLLLLRKIVLG